MSVTTFYDKTVAKHTGDRGHNVATRWRSVAKALRDQIAESERKTDALFDSMSNQLDAALSKAEKAEKALKEIWDLTDPYADGVEDASAHDRLCANVSGIARPWKDKK